MYFSGSEFHNKLLAMSGIFIKQKNGFERKINILEVTGNKYFFGAKAKFFNIQNKRKFNIALNFWQPTRMSKFGNLLQQTMSSLENMSNCQLYQSFTDINKTGSSKKPNSEHL